jgi:DNA-binding CsgD family transcriptional regulator/tetratricopeptide (TPR) repeat protein
MVELRMAQLGEPARRLLEVAAVAGDAASGEVLAAVAGLSPSALDAALREAREHHLLAPLPSGSFAEDHVSLRHILVREVIREGLSGPRRREIHAAVAAALERLPAPAGVSEMEQASALAGHLLLAGRPAEALPVLLREAAAAERARAFDVADRAYRTALDAWRTVEGERLTDLPPRAEVLERAALAASLSGRARDAVAWAEEALAASRAGGDGEQIARLLMHLGRYLGEAGWPDAALDAATQALEAAPAGSILAVRCQIGVARRLLGVGRPEEAAAHAAAAAQLAGSLRAAPEAGQARSVEALALSRAGRVADALRALDAVPRVRRHGPSLTASLRPSRLPEAVQALLDRAVVLDRAGRPEEAAEVALAGDAEARRRGLSRTLGGVLRAVAVRQLIWVGRWDDAAALLDDVTGPEGEEGAELSLVRALLATRRGDWQLAEAARSVTGEAPAGAVSTGWTSLAALVGVEMACWRRRYSEARDSLARGVDEASSEGDLPGLASLAGIGVRLAADALAARPRRRPADAMAAEEAAAHWHLRLVAASAGSGEGEGAHDAAARSSRGAALLASGTAELARVTDPAAVAPWRAAVAGWEATGDPYEAAYARFRLSEALLLGGDGRAEASDALRLGLEAADRLKAEPLAREMEELARRARLGPMSRAAFAGAGLSGGRHAARDLGLSEREVEVLELLAEGLSDREIAGRLFITTKTAGHHVSHILVKLGVSRRGEAAAIAHRIGVGPGER